MTFVNTLGMSTGGGKAEANMFFRSIDKASLASARLSGYGLQNAGNFLLKRVAKRSRLGVPKA